jgi:hypothetical protein
MHALFIRKKLDNLVLRRPLSSRLATVRIATVIVLVLLCGPQWGSARTCSAQADQSTPKPLKALLVTGGCCHDYPRQEQILAAGMESRLVWNNEYKGVRLFATSLGHHHVTMESEEWARGIQWAMLGSQHGDTEHSRVSSETKDGVKEG